MSARHVDDAVLARYATGEVVSTDAREHITSCERCLRVVEIATRMDASDAVAAAAEQADEITELVSELLSAPESERYNLANTDRYARAPIAQRFNALAREVLNRDLNSARSHIHVATTVLGRIRQHAATAFEVEFSAWRDASTIHRLRGEIGAARVCLVRAGDVAARCEDRELKFAILDYASALLAIDRDVMALDEARALLDRCEPVFRGRDQERYIGALTTRGIAYMKDGDACSARNLFVRVLAQAPPDGPARADAERNLASALVDLGELDAAEHLNASARLRYRTAGLAVRVAQSDAALAEVAHARGDYARAAEILASITDALRAAGDLETWLIASMNRVTALVAMNEPTSACALLRELIAASIGDSERSRFTAEAITYLRTLAEAERLTSDVAATVTKYVTRIHTAQAVPFRPPFPVLVM